MARKLLKTLALIMAICIVATCLFGCGKEKEVTLGTVGSPIKYNGDEIYPIECEDTLTYWFDATAVWDQKYENYADTPVGQEVAKKSGVKIEYIHPAKGQGGEQFQIMVASDELTDLVNADWYSFAGGPDSAIEQDYIYELTDIIKEYCPGVSKIYSENDHFRKDHTTDSGKMYALKSFIGEDPVMRVVYGPIVRKDFMDKFGLKAPVTIDDWENVLTTFKENGIEVPFSGLKSNMIKTFYPAFGGTFGWYQDNGKIVYGQAQPQYKDFLAKMNDWYNKGLIDRDFPAKDDANTTADILNGKSGAYIGYAGSGLGTMVEAGKDVEGFDLMGVQYPVMKKGDKNAEYSEINKIVSAGGVSTAISKKCKNVELAARFLDFGFSEVGHMVYNFGVEGESYEWIDKDGEKYPQFTDLINHNPEGFTSSDMIHMYTRSAHSNVPLMTDARFMEQFYLHPQQRQAQVEWAKTNMTEHHIPSVYILPEESDESANLMATITTYIDEMTIKFITGEEPIDNFDKYIAQLKEFGIEKVTKFRQDALGRYNKR